jgi:hypothetical protein
MTMNDPKDDAQEKLKVEGLSLGLFQHYKGPQYEAFALSIDELTLEPLVHYRSLAHGTSWTRTVKNFIEEVEVDGKKVPRFAKVEALGGVGLLAKAWAWMKAHFTNSWMASDDFDATMAHIGWACLITLATLIVTIAMRMPIPRAVLPACVWCSGALVVFGLVKEFWFDLRFEIPKQTAWDGVKDFLGYLGGLALAWAVIGVSLLFKQ